MGGLTETAGGEGGGNVEGLMQADPFKENLESRKMKEITPNASERHKHTKSFPTLLGKEKKKKNNTHTGWEQAAQVKESLQLWPAQQEACKAFHFVPKIH